MLTYLSTGKLIYLIYQSVEELTVVAHDDSGAVECLDGFLQHILRLHVEMVGRLIENQEIHRFEQELDHRQTTALSSTQHLDILLGSFATKHKGTQQIVHLETHLTGSHIVDGLEDGKLLVEQLCLVLCEITNLHVMTYLEIARKRNLAHDTLHQSRFTLAVLTYECHFLATLDGKGHMVEDGMIAIILSHLIADNRIIAATETRRELEMHLLGIHLVHLDRNDFLQLLDAALHLYSLGWLIAESLDEVLDIGYFLLLVFVSAELLLTALGTKNHILIVFHLVILYPSAGNLQGAVGYIIDKGTVVTYQHHRLGTLSQELLQPLDTLDIEVVGRLIEEEYIRLLEQDLCQLDTHTPSTGELPGRTVEIFTGETQTAQGSLNLSLVVFTAHHHVALVLLGEFLHELGIALALVVGAVGHFLLHLVEARLHLGIVGESLAGFLLHGGIILQFHHLRKIADRGFIRDSHHTGGWLLQATENLQHRRFAGTVFTYQGNAVAVVDYEAYIIEKWLYAKLYFQSFY